jgi:hypothetical protein
MLSVDLTSGLRTVRIGVIQRINHLRREMMDDLGGWEKLHGGIGRLRLCGVESQPIGETN